MTTTTPKRINTGNKASKPKAKMLSFLALPRRSVDNSVSLHLNGKSKTFAPMAIIPLKSTLEEVDNIEKNLKEVLAYCFNAKTTKSLNLRLMINTSAYSGGNRLGLCKGKGNSVQCVISNTGKQLTFQRQANVLPLEKLDAFAKTLGMAQINPKGNPTGSFCAYSVYNVSKAKSLVDKALELIKG